MRPDVHQQVDEESLEEKGKCQARRDRVLAHPDIARLLCKAPFNLAAPEFWGGYIPPKYHMGKVNDSPIRKQILAILNMVVERENQQVATAPVLIEGKTLQILHICLTEYGITEREDKLDYLRTRTGRDIKSSKELYNHEGLEETQILRKLIRDEQAAGNAAQAVDETAPVVSEVTGERIPGGADGGWPTEDEPPY